MNFFPHNIQGDLSDYNLHSQSNPYFPGNKKNSKYYYKIVSKNLYRITIIFCKEDYYDGFFKKHYLKGDRLYTFFHEEIQNDDSRKIKKIKRWKENNNKYMFINKIKNIIINDLKSIIISYL